MFTIKAHRTSDGCIRALSPFDHATRSPTWHSLSSQLLSAFHHDTPNNQPRIVSATYIDADGDTILIDTTTELLEAIASRALAGHRSLKLHIRFEKNFESSSSSSPPPYADRDPPRYRTASPSRKLGSCERGHVILRIGQRRLELGPSQSPESDAERKASASAFDAISEMFRPAYQNIKGCLAPGDVAAFDDVVGEMQERVLRPVVDGCLRGMEVKRCD